MQTITERNLSLLSIKHTSRILVINSNELVFEDSPHQRREDTLWSIMYYPPSSWILIHKKTSPSFTLNIQSGSHQLVKIKDQQHLFLLCVFTDNTRPNSGVGLKLFIRNSLECTNSPVFFVSEQDTQIYDYIDSNFFKRNPKHMNNIPVALGDSHYDFVVIGSSFCALAFIYRTLENNPEAKILVVEQGFSYLSQHHQHGPACASPGEVEFRPWSISPETLSDGFIENVHGQIPLLGGRSTYWSGWSPTPTTKELAGWPEQLIASLQTNYFELARQLLGVVAANNQTVRHNSNLLYGTFQDCLKSCLDSAYCIESVEQVIHAPLATGNGESIKFSTPERLLSMNNVTVVYNTTVEKILHNRGRATALQINQGQILPLNGAKLILAMSTLPATTLVLNSFQPSEFPELSHVGKRFSAHFISSVVARVPRRNLLSSSHTSDIELGAAYIAGTKDQGQYHLQLSAVSYERCNDPKNIHSICKKYSANSIPIECIDTSQDYAVVSCSTLGELNYRNTNNQFTVQDNHPNLHANGLLKVHVDDQDKALWDWMDDVTFKIMRQLSIAPDNNDLQYWDETAKTWNKDMPSSDTIRKKRLVHDTSTMWIGDSHDEDAPVNEDYRLKGIENVYITGGALWPTGGSWNPVVTIVAMAMHLADTIHQNTYA